MKIKRLLPVITAIATTTAAHAQSSDNVTPLRPVISAYTIEAGSSSMADAYLSPVTYRGWSTAVGYERLQAMKFDPERWVMQLQAHFGLDRGRNEADNGTTWRIDAEFSWGMMRRFEMPRSITLGVGGSTSLNGGCLYNGRNSNNPASAKAAWTVNLTGYAAWNTSIGRLPVTLRYQPTLPLAGIFFSPEYDELYYEIYLGNHDGLVHFAWPGSRFAMTNYVSADLHFGSTILRLGYRSTSMSSKANNLVTNVYTNAFVIGLTTEWLSLSRSTAPSPDTRIISALY